MSTPWSETLFPYGAPVGVAPASAISNDLQINKNNPGVQFLGTEANAVFSEEREIAGDLWFVTNATYASTGTPGQWAQSNAAAASYALVLRAAGQVQRLTAPAASPNPVVWTTVSSTDALGNVTLSAGTLTSPSLVPLAVTATWNAPAQAMTAARVNVTDTASASNSLLLDLQVGGVSKFSVRKDGTGTGFIDTTAGAQTKAGPLTVGPAPTGTTNPIAEIVAQGRFRSITTTGAPTQSSGSIQLGDPAYVAATLDWQESAANTFALRRNDTGLYAPLYVGSVSLQGVGTQFNGSGAGLTAGTVPNAALVTAPYTALTAGTGIGAIAAAPTATIALAHGDYADLASAQTITGAKTFSAMQTLSTYGSGATTLLVGAQSDAGAASSAGINIGIPSGVTTAPINIGKAGAQVFNVDSTGTLTVGIVPTSRLSGAYVTSVAAASSKVSIGGTAGAPTVDVVPANFSGIPWTALPYQPVQSVAAGSSKVTIGGTATAPTLDVVPANFTGIPWGALPYQPVQSVAAGSSKVSIAGTATAPTVDVVPGNFAAGTVPNASLVTTPVTSVTASGNLASSGGTTPAITMAASPSFTNLTLAGSLSGATTGGFSGAVTAGPTPTGVQSTTANVVSNGRLTTATTNGATGSVLFGAASPLVFDGGESVAGAFAHRSTATGNYVPVLAGPNASVGGYVPPVYTAAGAATASTEHIVRGSYAISSGTSVTVTLTGAAAFTAAGSYIVVVSPANASSTGTVYANRVSGTSFTINGVNLGQYDWIAIGT